MEDVTDQNGEIYDILEFQGPYRPSKYSSPCGEQTCFARNCSRFARVGRCQYGKGLKNHNTVAVGGHPNPTHCPSFTLVRCPSVLMSCCPGVWVSLYPGGTIKTHKQGGTNKTHEQGKQMKHTNRPRWRHFKGTLSPKTFSPYMKDITLLNITNKVKISFSPPFTPKIGDLAEIVRLEGSKKQAIV